MISLARLMSVLLLLFAGWRVFCQLAALEISRLYPTVEGFEQAVRWDPQGPEYHYRLGLIHRDNPEHRDLERSSRYVERATQLSPHTWWYWLELGKSYGVAAESTRAERAYLQAVELNPKDPEYRWTLANFYLREGRLDEALPQFEQTLALNRTDYIQGTLALLWKAGFASDDVLSVWPKDKESRLVLVGFLVEQSKLQALSTPQMTSLIDQQWHELLASPNHPTLVEGEFYVRYLMEKKRFREVRRAWVRLNRRDAFETRIWNGQFGLPLSGRVLGWRRDTSRITRNEETKVLRIEFDGTENVSFNGLQQIVVVEPREKYEFSFRARSEELSTEQGLYFEVVSGSVLLQTKPVLGTTPWTVYSGRFELPGDTQLVTVRLRRRPSRRIDNKFSGVLWLDWVKMERQVERQ